MKSFLLAVLFTLTLSTLAFSQMQFRVYEASIKNSPTNMEKILPDTTVSSTFLLNLDFDKNLLIFETGPRYKFTGELSRISDIEFFAYAYDKNSQLCKIWFKFLNDTYVFIGIEYKDVSFFYKTTLNKY